MKFPDLDYFNLLKKLAISTNILFIFLLLFNYLNFLPQVWNIFYIFYAVVAINTLFFALKIKSIPEDKRKNSKLIYFFGHFFILSLLIIAINQFLKRQIIIDFLGPITALSIAFGFLTFYAYKNKVEKEIEQEQITEQKAEVKRYNEFDKKFPRISKIWGLKHLIRWMYKEGWVYLLILLAILIIFTIIKAPYFGISFTGEHTMKYNTYVEPAKYMAEQNNLFLNQRKYLANPVTNPKGIFSSFGSMPIMEWGLFLIYKLLPSNSLEFNTRLFTHFLGILILISAYFFFSKWFSKFISLIFTFLLAINPIINLTTFVTVADSWLILFTFVSLIFFSNYLKNKRINNLFYSGILVGIAFSIKFSIILWLFPIVFFLMIYKFKELYRVFSSSGIFVFLTLLPYLCFKTSIKNFPKYSLFSFILFFIWILFFIFIWYFLKKKINLLEEFCKKIVENKPLFFISTIIILLMGIFFIWFNKLYSYFPEFLTDSQLLFNFTMYKYMLLEQFKIYLTNPMFFLGLMGFVFALFFGSKKVKMIVLAFFAGSLIYWILASKVIFFHNYYTCIIMITFSLSSTLLFNNFLKLSNKKLQAIFFLVIIGIIIIPPSSGQIDGFLSKEKGNFNDFLKIKDYLIENSNEDSIYIDDSYLLTLTILTGRSRIEEYNLIHQEIRDSIKKIGFSKTLKKYNIKYLITNRKEPRYERYANLFSNKDLSSISYRRTDLIKVKLNQAEDYFEDYDLREEIIEDFQIKEKFKLEEEFGAYKIYSFQN